MNTIGTQGNDGWMCVPFANLREKPIVGRSRPGVEADFDEF